MSTTGSLFVLTFFLPCEEMRSVPKDTKSYNIVVKRECLRVAKALDENLR